MLSVVCVLKSGGEYTPEYVHILRDSIARHMPDGVRYEFACLSDLPQERFEGGVKVLPLEHDLPGWWSKMELFAPRAQSTLRDRLFFDLDTAICASLAPIIQYVTGTWDKRAKFTVLRDFYRTTGYGSGVMFIPSGFGNEVWIEFMMDPERHMATFAGDQNFLEKYAPGAALWQTVCPDKFISYKPVPIDGAYRSKLPDRAAVLCFHGHPKPHAIRENKSKYPQWPLQHWRRENYDEFMGYTGTDDI